MAVTGANGFIGAHCVLKLLELGYVVHAVVRDPSNNTKVGFLRDLAEEMGASSNLKFFAGDLLQSGSYDEAFKGCAAVVHTAAVVEILDKSDAENKIVRPSIEGTENVLESIRKAGTVRKFVHTSSCIAIQSMDKPDDYVFTEEDWNEWSSIARGDAYGFAKTSAEKLVWKPGAVENCDIVVINPAVVIGPVLCKAHTKSSAVLVRQIVYNNAMLNYNCSFVDVRDVAQAFANALTVDEAQGERFLLVQGAPMETVGLVPIAQKVLPQYKLTAQPSPAPWQRALVTTLGALPLIGSAIISEFDLLSLTKRIAFDNAKSQKVLKIEYHSLEETVKDTVESMGKFIPLKSK